MVALDRKQSKIFASNAPLSQITVFRTTQTDSPQTSADPNVIQNDKYLDGWLNSDNTGNVLPYAEDMNAVMYTLSYNTSYLYEKGIPEYSSTQVYYVNSFCQYQGKLYRCKLDDTLNYVPTTTARWDEIPTSSYSATTIGAGTVNYGTVYAGTVGTQFQFKTIIGGANVSISETNDSLTISASVEGQTANFTANTPLNYTNGVLTIPAATSSQSGYLTAADWTSFNSKLSSTIFSANNTWTGSNTFADISATSLDLNGTTYTSIPTDTGDLTNGAGFITASALNSFSANSILATGTSSTLGSSSASWSSGYIDSIKTLAIDSPSPTSGNFVISSTARLYLKSYRSDSTNTTSLVFGGKTIIPETNLDINLGGLNNRFKNIYSNVIDLTYTTGTGGEGATLRSDQRLYLMSYKGETSQTTLYMGGNCLVPEVDNTVSLGLNGYSWASGYFYGASITATDIRPTVNEAKNLGTSGYRWKTYYGSEIDLSQQTISGTTYIAEVHSDNRLYLSSFKGGTSETTLYMGGNSLVPSADNKVHLGLGNGYKWLEVQAYAFNGASDRRVKSNIETLEDALEKLNTIAVKSYTMINHDEGIHYGFIAQDELERNPELIIVPEGYSEDDISKGTLGYSLSNVLFLAVKAIQELSAKVDSLEQQLKEI